MKILMLNSAVYDYRFADAASIHTTPLALELSAKHHVSVVGQIEQSIATGDKLSVTRITAPLSRWASLYSKPSLVLGVVHRAGIVLAILHACLLANLKERFDVIYARHGLPSLAGALLSRMIGIPMVVELNGLLNLDAEIFHWPRLARYFTKFIETFVFHSTDAIVAVTEELKNEILARFHFDNLMTVVPVGVDTELFRPRNKNEARKECTIPPQIQVVCFVGNLMPWHGLKNLIRCAPEVVKRFPNTLFIVVGDGPQKRDLNLFADSLRVSSAFYFAGKIPHTEVPNYVNCADVCVAPFGRVRTTTSPLKLYEYMSCGKPVVASDISPVGELLAKYSCGILVQPDDSHDLARAIIRVLQDRNLALRIGMQARRIALQFFSWRAIAEKIARVCEAAIYTRQELLLPSRALRNES
jgi:glycosyltransferase involved in cell wall biosynthesis